MKPKAKSAIGFSLAALVVITVFIFAVIKSSNFTAKETKPATVSEIKKELDTTAQAKQPVSENDKQLKPQPAPSSSPPKPLPNSGPGNIFLASLIVAVLAAVTYEFFNYFKIYLGSV